MNQGGSILAIRCLLLVLIALLPPSVGNAFPRLAFTLESIRHPVFNVRTLEFEFVSGSKGKQLEIMIGEVTIQDRIWRNLKLQCQDFQLSSSQIACDGGRLRIAGKYLPVIFRYRKKPQQLLLVVKPSQHERWRLAINWQNPDWQADLKITNGDSQRIADWLPQNESWPQLQAGTLNGRIDVSGYQDVIATWVANLEVKALAFSDSQGLHAGEQLALRLNARAKQEKNTWYWQGIFNWLNGEVFWQPFYFSGVGQQLAVNGTFDDHKFLVEQGELQLTGIGKFLFAGEMNIADQQLRRAHLQAEKLVLENLFTGIIQPLAANTALAETSAQGRLGVDWRYQDDENHSLVLELQDVALTDAQGRFSVNGVNALIPWHSDRTATGNIHLTQGEFLHIPVGEMTAIVTTHASGFNVPFVTIPILDGGIQVENLEVAKAPSGWQWQFNGKLLPLSMEKLTEALKVTPMFGTLSGIIPQMTYTDAVMTMNGVLVFDVFDGAVVARNLTLIEPLGLAPHLLMDIGMHYIDLDLLTRAYSFGNMQGRIDVEINAMELVNWQPIKFDARLVSSPGSYKKRISQAAIQNLTALGGASVMSVVQRSFLQIFEDFSYARIGWRCRLQGNICEMTGIETADIEQSPDQMEDYVLVQGSGIPAITITGYNRRVDWHELIKRLDNSVESGNPTIH